MTGGIEAGPLFHRGDFPPQIRNAVRAARIGRRGEQPDDAVFADEIARRVETFDPDVVEVDAPVHTRVHVGLGYDQQPRLLHKSHDLWRGFEQLVAASEHAEFTRTHDTERAFEIRIQRLAVNLVVAHTQEREIVGEQPLEKLDGFGNFINGQRRRSGLEFGDYRSDAITHRAPILHREAYLAEHDFQRMHKIGAGAIRNGRQMNMNEALAHVGSVRCIDAGELAARAANAEHRVRDETDIESALGDLAHYRIDQKRHVVVDDLYYRDRVAIG